MPTMALSRFPTLFAPRAADSHKGSFGTLAVIGGAVGMSGALVLAGSAALLSGCGRVFAAFCQEKLPLPWIAEYPEIMLATSETVFAHSAITCWAAGCGMGTEEHAGTTLSRLIRHCHERRQPLVLDADALNMLALRPALTHQLAKTDALKILTPHPGEAARLLNTNIAAIQRQRVDHARILAEQYGAWVVLKGWESVIAAPSGEYVVNDSGNAALATAGSGDVLTGMIAAFVAQGIPAQEAVCGAVWLHGRAADEYCCDGVPLAGLLAGEIARKARSIRQRLSALAQHSQT